MADITVTAAQVSPIFPEKAEIVDVIASEAITQGQLVYLTTAGKAAVADANTAGKEQVRGIALKKAAAGQAVSILKRGHVAGFDVSAKNGDIALYLSDTAGAMADAASATKTVNVGRVAVLTDKSGTKVVYFEADWLRSW